MEKREINPWKWQEERSYSQAVEVKNHSSILYCSGQAAIDPNGISSNEDMESQLRLAISNLNEVITSAGYEKQGIVRLTIYTTSTRELWPLFPILQDWIAKHNIKTALTLMQVTALYETLKVELEATVVK